MDDDDPPLFSKPKSSAGMLLRFVLGLGATLLCLPGMNALLDLISGHHNSIWWLVTGALGGAAWYLIKEMPPPERKNR